MSNKPRLQLILVATSVFILFACAPRQSLKGSAPSREQIQALVEELEPLLSGGYRTPAKIGEFTKTFKTYGCKEAWVAERDLESERLDRARDIALKNPEAITEMEKMRDPQALFVAGALRKKGLVYGPSKDPSGSAHIRRAAKNGNPHAIFLEAEELMRRFPFYSNQPGDPKKFIEINEMLRRAALAGSGRAAHELARRTQSFVFPLFPGRSIPGSEKTALEWWALGAQLGDAQAQESYAKFGRLSPDEKRRWMEASARAGHEIANYDVAGAYENGTDGFPADLDKAIEYHCRAIYFGNQWSPQALPKIIAFRAAAAAPAGTTPPGPLLTNVVFATGLGTGPHDRMTYASYQSSMTFTPGTTLDVAAIKPVLWYCNGLCFTEATVTDPAGRVLARTSWQGTTISTPYTPLPSKLILKKGKPVVFFLKTWTTKSIGIITTGAGVRSFPDGGRIEPNTSTMGERGAVAFELLR